MSIKILCGLLLCPVNIWCSIGSVARGQTERSNGWGIAPPATAMFRMKYSCDAESFAQQHVSTCNPRPLPPYAMQGYKENIQVLRTVRTNQGGAARNTFAGLERHVICASISKMGGL
ncbi:hypothetical protein Y032_0012g1875 [Ancylostoma ceylanicum]|uniref:Uncharacterized protein n=1 Tax=Ancylostoma ceylanicum TaxID=53326 RepID=A0A016VDA7_9BILA|nr:hypothetical protein Y032_0012g1875 [Ancylostoma ceylanicum]